MTGSDERRDGGEEAVEVYVHAIAAGGSGVGELPDGRVVFVPRTAPGDRARIRVEKHKRRWAVGSVESIVEPGPHRSEPPCPLYARCGGCQLQHLPYERQLEWKGRFVQDALGRIGGVDVAEPPEVVGSPLTTRYRNRITYTLRRLRGGRLVAGFHALGRPAHVIEVHEECVLPEASLTEAWTALRSSWGPGAELLPQGGRLRLTLHAVDDGVELDVEGGAGGWRPDALLAAVPALSAARHRPSGSKESEGGEEGGRAFVQVNRDAAELLRAHVLEVAGGASSAPDGATDAPSVPEGAGGAPSAPAGAGSAVDAYCGVGAFGHALAGAGWRVVGIESDPAAVSAAASSAPTGFSVVEGRVEERLADRLPADLLVLNPPRSGLDPDVPGIVLAAPPSRIVYVSCDPATLARDVAALSDAYELGRLRAFDLFPQTAHVETVAELVLRGRSDRDGGPERGAGT